MPASTAGVAVVTAHSGRRSERGIWEFPENADVPIFIHNELKDDTATIKSF